MSSYKRFGIAFPVVLLVCSIVMPASQAQTRILSNIWTLAPEGAYLGIHMKEVTADNMARYKLSSEKGVIVDQVVKNSPAESAGIKEDDVILEFGGFMVWSSTQLARLVQETPPGRKVDLVISRDGKKTTITVTLEARDERRMLGRSDSPSRSRDWDVPDRFSFRLPEFLDRWRSAPPAPRGRMGISVQPLTQQLAEYLGVPGKKGVLVTEVMEGSASAGKLRSGDVIIRVDGKAIEDLEDLTSVIQSKKEGNIEIRVIRDKKEVTVVVNLPSTEDKGYRL